MKSQFNHENMNGNQNKRNKHNNNKQFSKPTVKHEVQNISLFTHWNSYCLKMKISH